MNKNNGKQTAKPKINVQQIIAIILLLALIAMAVAQMML